uniref:Pinin/SDK/MemA protein domain-containing protein n=1 Tax=Globodera rostochiensis TaxID=31243 RepID=A0A914I8K1_GLORO
MKKNENKQDQVRNRRLFGNLLVATLRQFQKEEKTVGNKGHAQIEKQREVERRLEETEKENRNRLMRERETLMAKKREKEVEIQALRRQKAIEQSAEEKTKHFRRLQCFIQTQTKPPLFFLPSKHTLRTLELLKESSKKIETLIELRREEMDRELRRLDSYTSVGGLGGAIGHAKNATAEESDDDDDVRGGLKSAIVVKVEGGTEETAAGMEEEQKEGEEEEEVEKEAEGEGDEQPQQIVAQNGGEGSGAEEPDQGDEEENGERNNNEEDEVVGTEEEMNAGDE